MSDGRTIKQIGIFIFLSVLLYASVHGGRMTASPDLLGDIQIHDPSLIKQGNTYYLFSTGDSRGIVNQGNIQIRKSTDLINWEFVGTVFDTTPEWITRVLGFRPRSIWAPDISYFNGKYYLYYAGSGFGTNNSVIGLATNVTLDPASPSYKWVDQGEVIRSTASDKWNAIDPQLSFDAGNNPWLSFGSFWDGIKMRRIDPITGKLSATDPTLYSLASRGGGPIEAPGIIRRNNYYYLFASFDFCCRKANSTYKIVVGRATSITGPYSDREGRRMDQGGGDLLLAGYERYRGTGGQSVYLDGNTYRLVLHYYDGRDNGIHKLQIRNLAWTNDDWPVVEEPLGASRAAIGQWSFDEGRGTTAADISGSGNNGLLVNDPTWGNGRMNGALKFDGTSAYVDVPTNVIDLSGSFTVAAWVRLDHLGGDQAAVSQDGNTASGFYLGSLASTRKFAFMLPEADADDADGWVANSKTIPVKGKWYRLVGVRDARGRQLRLYVNGHLEGTAPINRPWWASGHTVIGRARRAGKPADFWLGSIDDVRLYSRALPPAEIKALP
jgi:arabinan endo-1,5-alpha-L-arabinosidase